MSKTFTKTDASKILSAVPPENVFRFCTAEGVFTKIAASSLEDFADKLGSIDENSILFHYPRGDFQAWIKGTVGDIELSNKMCFIQQGISGQKLRQELLKILQKRISELNTLKQDVFPSNQCNKDGLCLS